jgi:predicted AAA+ superfamily ATPase
MLPPERRLPGVLPLIVRGQYFVVHSPRQSGKTTFFRTLAEHLTAEGRYTALLTTCETGRTLEKDLDGAMTAVLETMLQKAGESLPADLQPPAPDPSMNARTRLYDLV